MAKGKIVDKTAAQVIASSFETSALSHLRERLRRILRAGVAL